MEQESKPLGGCVVYEFQGTICGDPGQEFDPLRGGPVCKRHLEKKVQSVQDFLSRARHAGI